MNEIEWISFLKKEFPIFESQSLFGIGDDTAIFPYNDTKSYIFKNQIFLEDIHFSFDWISLEDLGYRSLAITLNDIAAMGGIPLYCFFSFAMPKKKAPWDSIKKLYQKMHILMKQYNIKLLGGDTSQSIKGYFFSVSIVGQVNKNQILKRSEAQLGDFIYLSGPLGNSACILEILKKKGLGYTQKKFKKFLNKYIFPKVHINLIQELLKKNYPIHCAIDLSDGLSASLAKITNQDQEKAAIIFWNKIPKSKIFLNQKNKSQEEQKNIKKLVLESGEDYEILFTSPKDISGDFFNKKIKYPVKKIGFIKKGKYNYLIKGEKKEKIISNGYQHFE